MTTQVGAVPTGGGKGNGRIFDSARAFWAVLTAFAVVVCAITGVFWSKIEDHDARIRVEERERAKMDPKLDEVLRRLDRMEMKIDKNGDKR